VTHATARLWAAVRDSASPLADALAEAPPAAPAAPAAVAAAGPRIDADSAADVELAVTAVHEGYRLHYGGSRALAVDDPDLALLAGDRLYALGLDGLADLGDLAAIGELADVIALGAQAHASGDEALAAATWEAGAAAIGWGPDARIEAAKERARAGDPAAPAALRAAARDARAGATS
jgi:hypothetical protein